MNENNATEKLLKPICETLEWIREGNYCQHRLDLFCEALKPQHGYGAKVVEVVRQILEALRLELPHNGLGEALVTAKQDLRFMIQEKEAEAKALKGDEGEDEQEE